MENISWLGHAGFSFIDIKSGNKIYYVDPFKLTIQNPDKADIIFVTHAHPDHLSQPDISNLLKESTTVVATKDSLDTLKIMQDKVTVVPGRSYKVKDFEFSTIPAYNLNPLRPHKKEYDWVGYIFHINNKLVYHAGDTDYIPEMDGLKTLGLDIALLPIGGTYTMDVEEAIIAANAISAKKTIPMHYKMLLGDKFKEAEERFLKGVKNSEVLFLDEVR